MKLNVKKFVGLYTHPNPLSEVPEGALSIANDCSIDREGIIENRRGFNFYGSSLSSAVQAPLKFKNKIIANFGSTLAYDSNGAGTFVNYIGSYTPPTGNKIRSIEQNGSLFFTTNNGVYKLDSLTGTPQPAGIPKPLDMVTSFSSDSIGFMPYNAQVAYRMVWQRKDANQITTTSAPSQRKEVVNSLVDLVSITKSGSTATATSAGPHNLSANDIVDIANAESFLNLSSLTQTGGTVTGTTASAHGILAGDTVVIRGAGPIDYNGSFIVQTVPTSTTFTYSIVSTPTSPAIGTPQVGRDPTLFNGTFLILSAPTPTTFTYTLIGNPLSNAIAVANKSMTMGKNRDITITFPVPVGIIAGDLFQIYRSETSVDASVTASDKMQLVYQGTYTSGTSVTITDVTPDNFKGADLYTNTTQEGIAQENDTPPLAADLAFYKNVLFYANTSTKENLSLQLLSPDGLVRDTDYVDFAGTQYYFSSVESLTGVLSFRLFADIAGASVSRSSTTATITTPVNHGLSVGDTIYLSGAADARYNTSFTVQTVPSVTTFTVTVTTSFATSDTVKVSTGTPAQNIADTVLSLCKVINRTSENLYAYYTSGPDDIPGSFELVAQNLSFPVFYAVASASASPRFSPLIPTGGTSLPSTNEALANRLYYSKTQQPDSVPYLNYFDIGPRDEKILRIVGLRDSLFIIKEQSVYRLSGDDSRSFSVTLFDNNISCKGPETVAQLNNTIYMYSSQGVVSVGDGGVAVVSHNIEKDLLPLTGYANSSTIMHGIGYEAERKYILFFQNLSSDTVATAAYVYNTFTQAWTKWLKPANCAVVLSDTLYLGNTYSNTILKERKQRDRTDKKDEAAPVTLAVDSTGLIITVSGYSYGGFSLSPGQLIEQPGKYAKVLSVVGNVATVDRVASFTNGAGTLANPIKYYWRLMPQTCSTGFVPGQGVSGPGNLKQFREVQAYPLEDTFSNCTLVFNSDLANIDKTVTFTFAGREQGFGFTPFGSAPWGDVGNLTGSTPLRTYVPQGIQRSRALVVGGLHSVAEENIAFLNVGYVYEDNSERTTR